MSNMHDNIAAEVACLASNIGAIAGKLAESTTTDDAIDDANRKRKRLDDGQASRPDSHSDETSVKTNVMSFQKDLELSAAQMEVIHLKLELARERQARIAAESGLATERQAKIAAETSLSTMKTDFEKTTDDLKKALLEEQKLHMDAPQEHILQVRQRDHWDEPQTQGPRIVVRAFPGIWAQICPGSSVGCTCARCTSATRWREKPSRDCCCFSAPPSG